MKTTEVQQAASRHWPARVLRVGDLITAYKKGYHVVTRIFLREKEAGDLHDPDPLIYYKQVCNSSGVPTKRAKTEHCCDILYCHPAFETIREARKVLNRVEETLWLYKS